jgi:hypothetical protein
LIDELRGPLQILVVDELRGGVDAKSYQTVATDMDFLITTWMWMVIDSKEC